MSKVTLKDVAAQVGVSYQTVSKVLNKKAHVTPETEARIWQAVQELNYKPNVAARNLRTQTSYLIGYAWRHIDMTWRPILDSFLHNIIDAAEAEGYLTVFFSDECSKTCMTPASYAELYARKQVDGFVLAEIVEDDPRVAFLINQKIPFVSFGRANDSWNHCWVDVDGYVGIDAVMSHLVKQGHKRVAFINWSQTQYRTGQHREQAYKFKMRQAGTTIDPDWIFCGPNSVETGVQGMDFFLSLPVQRRPSAVVCVSDQIALGAINAACAAGVQVGQDIAVTGYDDFPLAKHLHPPLTTVRQPITEVGRHVVKLLVKRIRGEPIDQKGVLLSPELVVRESS